METALVTGAFGFLGSHIVSELKKHYQVLTLGINKGNDYPVDLSKQVPGLNNSVELVVHAAGLAHNKQVSPYNMEAVNVIGTKNLCAALDNLHQYPKQFVFISTVAVYGIVAGENVNEKTPLNGESAYAKSKIAGEQFVSSWCKKHSIICTILRLPLIVGKDAPGNIASIKNAIAKKRFFIPGNGKAKKSMVLAEDVASIIPLAASFGGIYNLTDGCHPTLEIFSLLLAKHTNNEKLFYLPMWLCKLLAAAGDLAGGMFAFDSKILAQLTSTLTFDDSCAKQTLGWKPKAVADFTDW